MMQLRLRPSFFLFASSIAVLLCFPAAASSQAFLLVYNDDEGAQIEGQLITPDNVPDAMWVTEFHHLVRREYDAGGGGGGGGSIPYTLPQHRPLVVTIPLGFSTPQLFRAFSRNDRLAVTLKLYSQNQSQNQLQYEVILLAAYLVAIEPVTLENNGTLYEYQKLRFIYEQMIFHDEAAGPDMDWQLASWPF